MLGWTIAICMDLFEASFYSHSFVQMFSVLWYQKCLVNTNPEVNHYGHLNINFLHAMGTLHNREGSILEEFCWSIKFCPSITNMWQCFLYKIRETSTLHNFRLGNPKYKKLKPGWTSTFVREAFASMDYNETLFSAHIVKCDKKMRHESLEICRYSINGSSHTWVRWNNLKDSPTTFPCLLKFKYHNFKGVIKTQEKLEWGLFLTSTQTRNWICQISQILSFCNRDWLQKSPDFELFSYSTYHIDEWNATKNETPIFGS